MDNVTGLYEENMTPALRYRFLLAALATAALSGCIVAPIGPYRGAIQVAPPPVRYEAIGAPPAAGYLWIDGYWNWAGGRHVWQPGNWSAPRPGYRWAPHRWERGGQGWEQRQGHWERH